MLQFAAAAKSIKYWLGERNTVYQQAIEKKSHD